MNVPWSRLPGFVPSGMVLFCAFLSFAIPFLVYRFNRSLHQKGDPPWMKQAGGEAAQSGPEATGGAGAEADAAPGAGAGAEAETDAGAGQGG